MWGSSVFHPDVTVSNGPASEITANANVFFGYSKEKFAHLFLHHKGSLKYGNNFLL